MRYLWAALPFWPVAAFALLGIWRAPIGLAVDSPLGAPFDFHAAADFSNRMSADAASDDLCRAAPIVRLSVACVARRCRGAQKDGVFDL